MDNVQKQIVTGVGDKGLGELLIINKDLENTENCLINL